MIFAPYCKRHLAAVVASALAGAGCAGGGTAPYSPQEAIDGPFAFLRQCYDRDQNGAIERVEYGPGDGSFARLDVDGDGVLTAKDFAKEGRRLRSLSPEAQRRLQAQHLVGWYLQDDEQLGQTAS